MQQREAKAEKWALILGASGGFGAASLLGVTENAARPGPDALRPGEAVEGISCTSPQSSPLICRISPLHSTRICFRSPPARKV